MKKLTEVSIKHRILKGMGANGFGQLVTVLSQLLIIPILIASWGAEVFGVWLAISAIPAYLSFANLGVAPYGATILTTYTAGAGSYGDSYFLKIYNSIFWITTFVALLVFLISGLVIYCSVENYRPFSEYISEKEFLGVVLALVSSVVINMYFAVWDVIFRPAGDYALGIIWNNTTRLLEQVTIGLGVVLFEWSIVDVAVSILCVKSFGVVVCGLYCVLKYKIKPIRKIPELTDIKRILKESYGYMTMPLGYAFSTQGMIILAAMISPIFAASFGVIRTLVSAGRQMVLIVSQSVWPELSKAKGSKDQALFRNLFFKMLAFSMFMVLLGIFILYAGSEFIFKLWLGNTDLFNNELFWYMSFYTIISVFWNQFFIVLASVADVGRFSIYFLVLNCFAFFVSLLYTDFFLIVYCSVEVLILVVVVLLSKKHLDVNCVY
jgi:O-antigen/teichoic acid export membrane protein